MKTVVFATSNGGKLKEARFVLKRFGIAVRQAVIELDELQTDNISRIAAAKATRAASALQSPVIVEDTGFFMDAWGNFPGPYSKWVVNTIGFDGIMRLAQGTDRKAHFQTVVAFAQPGARFPKLFSGVARGSVPGAAGPAAHHARLGYDPLFIPIGSKKIYSQMTIAQKLANSSRSKALAAFGKWYSKQGKAR